jgi:hypothetical protein
MEKELVCKKELVTILGCRMAKVQICTPLREFTHLLLRVLYLQDGRRLYIISKGHLRIYVPQVLHLR